MHSSGLFDGFGAQRSMMSSIFGGRDPFDDPFFTRPFGSMSGSAMSGPFGDSAQVSRSKGPVIEELDNSDEGEEEEEEGYDKSARDEKYEAGNNNRSDKGPIVEHPDDGDNEAHSKDVSYRTDSNRVQGKQPQTRGVSFRKVSYGGIDGTYYTATKTRKTGSDGVMVEESKEADRTTGQASHRLSRGLHDKGHSVTRKLNPDGKVDTMQTLHNLKEDELTGFEEAWKGNVERNFPGWSDGSNLLGNAGASASGHRTGLRDWALPFVDSAGGTVGMRPNNEARTDSYGGRTKKVVRINIE